MAVGWVVSFSLVGEFHVVAGLQQQQLWVVESLEPLQLQAVSTVEKILVHLPGSGLAGFVSTVSSLFWFFFFFFFFGLDLNR